jgi:hypothetical protein
MLHVRCEDVNEGRTDDPVLLGAQGLGLEPVLEDAPIRIVGRKLLEQARVHAVDGPGMPLSGKDPVSIL